MIKIFAITTLLMLTACQTTNFGAILEATMVSFSCEMFRQTQSNLSPQEWEVLKLRFSKQAGSNATFQKVLLCMDSR